MPFCHPELARPWVVKDFMSPVGKVGFSSGPSQACQTAGAGKLRGGSQCHCLIVTPRQAAVRTFYSGDRSQREAPLTLFFGDSPRPSRGGATAVAVSRVGLPGDGINPRCSGGSAVRVSIGKAGQLECRRDYAQRQGCSYESLGLQARQYSPADRADCEAFLHDSAAPTAGAYLLKPAIGSFGRSIRYLPPGSGHAEAQRHCGGQVAIPP